MTEYAIGVDGGGTKTLGAIATLDGRVLAQAEVGSSNPHSNPLETVRANLKSLAENLLAQAGAAPDEIRAICLGMAGVDRPEDKPMIRNLVHEFLPAASVLPVNDGVIALTGGAGKPFGIIVISGTGSIAVGISRTGERARSGGWGHILGDEGSGYMIALRGLRAVMQAHDGRAPSTALRKMMLGHLGLERAEQLLGWVRDINGSKADIAALSRIVHQANEQGDGVAATILQEEAEALAVTAQAVAKKLFKPEETDWEVIVAGGNLRNSEDYFSLFRRALEPRLPGITVARPRKEPVEGAVLLAIESLKPGFVEM